MMETLFLLIIMGGAASFWYSFTYTKSFGEEALSFFLHFTAEMFLMYLIGAF